MYTVEDFKTKKALKEAVAAGKRVEVYQPGPFPGATNGSVALEGPHYPKPHTWYASAIIKDSIIVSVKTILLAVLLAGTLSANEKPKNIYKLTRLSSNEALITCQNGADPTIKPVINGAIVVSCGADLKAKWNGKEFFCPNGMFVWADESEAIAGKNDFAYCGNYPLQK